MGYTPCRQRCLNHAQNTMSNLNRATKAQLLELITEQAGATTALEKQVNESKEQVTVALWIAAVSFCLGLLF